MCIFYILAPPIDNPGIADFDNHNDYFYYGIKYYEMHNTTKTNELRSTTSLNSSEEYFQGLEKSAQSSSEA